MSKPKETFVHETAHVGAAAVLGSGSKIWHFCHVMDGARIGNDVVIGQNGFVGGSVIIGDGCRIQNNVSLYDGVELGEGVFVGPSFVFTNVKRPRALFPKKDQFLSSQVGAGASLGANATLICGNKIGRGAFVAAGAVVSRDVPDFALVTGCPARVVGYVCHCGEQLTWGDELLDQDLSCGICRREYRVRAKKVIER